MTIAKGIVKKSSVFTVWKEISKRFGQIGMVMPSSGSLARAMVKPMDAIHGARRILEVGPGTGPMTREILRRMGDKDTLVVCEINALFLFRLRHDLQFNKYYQKHKDRVRFYEGPVQGLRHSNIQTGYDFIVSSLPFLNFDAETVDDVFSLYTDLMSDRGVLSTCEYVAMRRLSLIFANAKNRERMREVDQVIKSWREKAKSTGSLKNDLSFFNVPPAYAVQYEYKGWSDRRHMSQ